MMGGKTGEERMEGEKCGMEGPKGSGCIYFYIIIFFFWFKNFFKKKYRKYVTFNLNEMRMRMK
jgi:hypothetical protein